MNWGGLEAGRALKPVRRLHCGWLQSRRLSTAVRAGRSLARTAACVGTAAELACLEASGGHTAPSRASARSDSVLRPRGPASRGTLTPCRAAPARQLEEVCHRGRDVAAALVAQPRMVRARICGRCSSTLPMALPMALNAQDKLCQSMPQSRPSGRPPSFDDVTGGAQGLVSLARLRRGRV